MDCRDVQRILWERGSPILMDEGPNDVAAHLEGCPSCRLESRRMTQLRAALADLQHELAAPPEELEPALIAAAARTTLERARELMVRPRFWRGAAVGAAAAATAAFGLIVARRFMRPDLAA